MIKGNHESKLRLLKRAVSQTVSAEAAKATSQESVELQTRRQALANNNNIRAAIIDSNNNNIIDDIDTSCNQFSCSSEHCSNSGKTKRKTKAMQLRV